MNWTRKVESYCVLFFVAWLLGGVTLRGEGPLLVGGPSLPGQPQKEGQPFHWGGNTQAFNSTTMTLSYWTDMGNLGGQTNAAADGLVDAAFKSWQDVTTANINFSKAGKLGQDVTSANAMTVLDAVRDCRTLPGPPAGGIAQPVSVVYDTDGSIFSALGEDPNMVLGFASALCPSSDGANNIYNRGGAVLNGKFIDGVDTASNPEVTLDEFKSVFIHEFGHMIGLDHTQINLQCLTGSSVCTTDDLAGVPIMFPVLISAKTVPTTDDVAGLSVLYPETVNDPANLHVPFNTMGRIQGRVFFSDRQVQAQGLDVIARQVDDPTTPTIDESRRIAVSVVSGFLFTVDAGSAAVPSSLTEDPFGSHDPMLIGFYDIPGLPVDKGQKYTIEVEAIHNSEPIPFVRGSRVGPIGDLGFQFPLPSILPAPPPCSVEFLGAVTATCDATQKTQLTPSAGTPLTTGTDVILLNTPPRFDAWEDGP